MLQNINKDLLIFFNEFTEHKFIEQIIYVFIDSPIFFLPIFLIGAWIYGTYNKNIKDTILHKTRLLFIYYSTIVALLISLFIQKIVKIDRPETALEGTKRLILEHIPDASFPSDHATVSIAFLAGLFFAGYKKTGYCFLPFVVIMNLSRVAGGIHWPFDILAGAIVGVLGAYISFKFLSQIQLVKNINTTIIRVLSYLKL